LGDVKIFGVEKDCWGKIIGCAKPCDPGPSSRQGGDDASSINWPKGLIHRFTSLHTQFFRRVNPFTIALVLPLAPMRRLLDGRHQKTAYFWLFYAFPLFP